MISPSSASRTSCARDERTKWVPRRRWSGILTLGIHRQCLPHLPKTHKSHSSSPKNHPHLPTSPRYVEAQSSNLSTPSTTSPRPPHPSPSLRIAQSATSTSRVAANSRCTFEAGDTQITTRVGCHDYCSSASHKCGKGQVPPPKGTLRSR